MTPRTFHTLGAIAGLLSFGYLAGQALADYPPANYRPPSVAATVSAQVSAELQRRSAVLRRARPTRVRCQAPRARAFWRSAWSCRVRWAGRTDTFRARVSVFEDGSVRSVSIRQPRAHRGAPRASAVSRQTWARLRLQAFKFPGVIRPPAGVPRCRHRRGSRWGCTRVRYVGYAETLTATAFASRRTLRVTRVDS